MKLNQYRYVFYVFHTFLVFYNFFTNNKNLVFQQITVFYNFPLYFYTFFLMSELFAVKYMFCKATMQQRKLKIEIHLNLNKCKLTHV